MTSPRGIHQAVDCIGARYRREEYFMGVEQDGDAVKLLVSAECPFATHRKIGKFEVRLVVAEEKEASEPTWLPPYPAKHWEWVR